MGNQSKYHGDGGKLENYPPAVDYIYALVYRQMGPAELGSQAWWKFLRLVEEAVANPNEHRLEAMITHAIVEFPNFVITVDEERQAYSLLSY